MVLQLFGRIHQGWGHHDRYLSTGRLARGWYHGHSRHPEILRDGSDTWLLYIIWFHTYRHACVDGCYEFRDAVHPPGHVSETSLWDHNLESSVDGLHTSIDTTTDTEKVQSIGPWRHICTDTWACSRSADLLERDTDQDLLVSVCVSAWAIMPSVSFYVTYFYAFLCVCNQAYDDTIARRMQGYIHILLENRIASFWKPGQL